MQNDEILLSSFKGKFHASRFINKLLKLQVVDRNNGAIGNARINTKSEFTFEPINLLTTFRTSIEKIENLQSDLNQNIMTLSMDIKNLKTNFFHTITSIKRKNDMSNSTFLPLDERVCSITSNFVNLGEELNFYNKPRTKIILTLKALHAFDNIMKNSLEAVAYLKNCHNRDNLIESAEIIIQLNQISQDSHLRSQLFMSEKYKTIESELTTAFKDYLFTNQHEILLKYSNLLIQFKGNNKMYELFAQECLKKSQLQGKDQFSSILDTCESGYKLAKLLFKKYDDSLELLIKFLFNNIQIMLDQCVTNENDLEKKLKNLHRLFKESIKIGETIKTYLTKKPNLISNLIHSIFGEMLKIYSNQEMDFIRREVSKMLMEYYDTVNHRRDISFQNKKGVQSMLRSNLRRRSSNQMLVSVDVVVGIINLVKPAMTRSNDILIYGSVQHYEQVSKILKFLIISIGDEHILYALESVVGYIPASFPIKNCNVSDLEFFRTVQNVIEVYSLYDNNMKAAFLPNIKEGIGSKCVSEVIEYNEDFISRMEFLINEGLGLFIKSSVKTIRNILYSFQKKSDFIISEKDHVNIECTKTSSQVFNFFHQVVSLLRENFDGQNIYEIYTEFGRAFHAIIFEHICQFKYTVSGGLVLLCDVDKYKECISGFSCELVTDLFDSLKNLCYLLIAETKNIKQVCQENRLAIIDATIIETIIQLRI
ncbi:Exocyst complex component Sec10 [Intoshia linei]|uniref:Exocyst complex component 5 n=1 Tax=Intoshia linei TaxID=1819745 RepID=A0A177B1D9_9BILA|nr:Exocyst complex component Sec10 [Intoshia linei]